MHTATNHVPTHRELVSALRHQFTIHGDDRSFTFLQETGRRLNPQVTSFRELDRGAREIAAWLTTRPEVAARPVLLLFEPGTDFWRAFLGCLYAGATAIPAPLPHDNRSFDRLAGILRDAGSRIVLTTTSLKDALTEGIEALGHDLDVVAVDDIRLADPDTWTMPGISPDTVAFLQYTSGSTGDPKGVAVTHGSTLHNRSAIAAALGLDEASVLVGWVPHFHDMGLISLIVAFATGFDAVMMSPLTFLKKPVRLLQAISDYRGTISSAPNFAYDVIARRVAPDAIAGLDLTSWKIALNGAEPIRRRTIERVAEVLAPAGFAATAMRPGYGMAEVTLLATISTGFRYLDADVEALERSRYQPATANAISLVSSGAPAPGIEVRIVDPETLVEQPEGHVGEIWLRSESVAGGYHNRPVETIERFTAHLADGRGPYLRSGDLGLVQAGELYVTGRRKDLIIVNGRNLYPQDIEDSVQDVHPAIAGSRGVAVAIDADDRETIALIQAVRPELLGDTSYEALAASVKTAVAQVFDVPAPRVVLIGRSGVHLTTSGKVQRASMRSAFLDGELADILFHSDAATPRPRLVNAQGAHE